MLVFSQVRREVKEEERKINFAFCECSTSEADI